MTAAHGPTGFLGLSHLGIVSSTGWASFGGSVIAVDLDATTVAALDRGELPVHEPGLRELFDRVRTRMLFSASPGMLSDCPLVIVARDVPTAADNSSDLAPVHALLDAAIPHFRDGVVLVVTSQVPPGFTRHLAEAIRARRPHLSFQLYYWIETLVFGNAVERYLRPERIVIGVDDPARSIAPALAVGLERFHCPVLRMVYESAELTKTAINLYLCAGVTYANTMADLCEAVGADWSEMMPALRLDRRIGPAAYIRPGPGIAGGNLERDMRTLQQLCRSQAIDAAFIDAMIAYNDRRYTWVHRKLREHVLATTNHPTVAVWGLTYKRDTRSTKNSIALRVIEELQGRAEIRAYDPVLRAGDVAVGAKIVDSAAEALEGADALVILTDWPQFAAPDPRALRAMRTPVVIDGVAVVDRTRADLAGVRYVAMGRP
jgi:UDPglucose 6-dehydrogenase